MSNVFKMAGDKIRGSPFIVVIWAAILAFAIVCGSLLFEAYTTSTLGYRMIPTQKANEFIVPLVGLLPILGQIVFTYAYISDTNRGWAGLIVFVLHLVDMATDVLYKINGHYDIGLIIVALIESEILYTVGAIMGFTFAVGMLIETTPVALPVIGEFIGALFAGFGKGAKSAVHGLGIVPKEPPAGDARDGRSIGNSREVQDPLGMNPRSGGR